MWSMAELTVHDLRAEPDTLEVVEFHETIGDGDVSEPHRHPYHELLWVREGTGRHLIDGAPVEFGPSTLTLIAKGQVHQFQRAAAVAGLVARFEDDWLTRSRRWLFSGQTCTPIAVPAEDARRFDALLDLLRVELERPARPESAELRSHLLRFTDLSIMEIAAELGFSDQFAFSKAFKRQRGEAPLDFRSRQGEDPERANQRSLQDRVPGE